MKNHHVNLASQSPSKKLLLALFKSDNSNEPLDCNRHRYFSALIVVYLSRVITTLN